MSATFATPVITQDGADLVRRARGQGRKFVFVDALSGTIYESHRSDLCHKPAAFFDGASGSVSAVLIDQGVFKVVAAFTAAAALQPVKSIAVRAKVAGEDDAAAIIFAACSDENSCIVLPGSGDAPIKFTFDLPMNLTADDVDAFGELPGTGVDLSHCATIDTAQTFTAGKSYAITEGEGAEAVTHEYPFASMPVKVEAGEGYVDITSGNGQVIRISENSGAITIPSMPIDEFVTMRVVPEIQSGTMTPDASDES